MSNLELRYVRMNEIHPNPWNPHGTTQEEMDALVESIASRGMVDAPLVVEWDADMEYEGEIVTAKGGYMIVDGQQKYTAYTNAFMRGLVDSPELPVLIMGKLSNHGRDSLAELGQILNHKGRGSLEDETKTAVITKWMLKTRSIEEVSKTVGQREDFLKRSLASLAASQRASAASQLSNTPAKPPTVTPRLERPQGYAERKNLVAVLPFEDELAVDEFESLVSNVLGTMEDDELPNTRGNKRTYAVLQALRNYQQHLIGEDLE